MAVPLLSVAVPSLVEPSMKSTFPVGAAVLGATAATTAVKVTDCPKTDGLGAAVSEVKAADALLIE